MRKYLLPKPGASKILKNAGGKGGGQFFAFVKLPVFILGLGNFDIMRKNKMWKVCIEALTNNKNRFF